MEFDTVMLTAAKPLLSPVVAKSDSGYEAIEMLLIQSRLQSMEFLRQYSDKWRWRPRVGMTDTCE